MIFPTSLPPSRSTAVAGAGVFECEPALAFAAGALALDAGVPTALAAGAPIALALAAGSAVALALVAGSAVALALGSAVALGVLGPPGPATSLAFPR